MTDTPPEWIQDHYDGNVPSIIEDPGGPIAIEGIEPEATITDAAETAAERMAERMEYELRGAWRAGYDYIHVYDKAELGKSDLAESFAVRQYVLPMNGEHVPRPQGFIYRHSYDLTSVPDDELREAIRGRDR